MIEGSDKVTIGGKSYMAAPLNFRALIEFAPFIESMRSGIAVTDLEKVAKLIAASVRRNDPAITDETLLDDLDLGTAKEALGIIMSLSGGKSATGSGEAKPVTSL